MAEEQAHEVDVVEEDQDDGQAVAEEAEPVEKEHAETPAEEEGEAEPFDELAILHLELEEARAKEAEYLDGWQRARAELANARKRFQRDQAQSYTNAKANVLASLLPIVDDFQRAFDTVPEELSDQTWIEGMKLIGHKFEMLLEQERVASIEATGEEFDPFLHEAVTHEPSETVPAGHVIAEMQKGYRMGDRVVRPSMVRVSSGPPSEPEPAEEETLTDEETPASDE